MGPLAGEGILSPPCRLCACVLVTWKFGLTPDAYLPDCLLISLSLPSSSVSSCNKAMGRRPSCYKCYEFSSIALALSLRSNCTFNSISGSTLIRVLLSFCFSDNIGVRYIS